MRNESPPFPPLVCACYVFPSPQQASQVTASGAVCEVKEDECVTCGACVASCTYGAIELRETAKGKKAWVNPILCKGDGLCNAKCPTEAIVLKHYTDQEVLGQIDAAAPHPKEAQGQTHEPA